MKLIIDIPDNLYATIIADEYGVHQGRIYDIIHKGTPLDDCEILTKETYSDLCLRASKSEKQGMKQTKSHAPVFRGSKPNSTTVCAYCPRCDAVIKRYRQDKCDNCGWEIYWMPLRI